MFHILGLLLYFSRHTIQVFLERILVKESCRYNIPLLYLTWRLSLDMMRDSHLDIMLSMFSNISHLLSTTHSR